MEATLDQLNLVVFDTETFVLTLKQRLESIPNLDGYEISQRDGRTLEVKVGREHGINGLFEGLSQQSIEVLSLRNKQNRLEQLFIDMLDATRNGNTT